MRRILPLLLCLGACDGWPGSTPPPPPAPPPGGSVAQGDAARRAGLAAPGPAVDTALLQRGEARYVIFCVPCHGSRGAGDGPVAARGSMPVPVIAGIASGRSMAAVTGNLAGAHPFEDRITPRDRWAIARFVERLREGGTP